MSIPAVEIKITGISHVPVDKVFDIVGGGTPSKRVAAYYGGGIPWATIRDMNSFELAETEHTITKAGLENSSSKLIRAGEVIMASRVGLGKACILKQDTAINQDIRALIPRISGSIDRRFCLYWLQSIEKTIIEAGSGATVQGIKLPFIKSLPFPNIPLAEQKRIVAVLDQAFAALDRARAHAGANLVDATELVAHAREHLFNPNQSGWQLRPLSEMISIKHGFAFKSEFFASEGEHVLLTPGNFFEAGGFRHRGSKQKYYVGDIPEGFVLNEGDLLMAMTEQAPGLLGSCILVPENDRFLHNQRLGLIQPLDGVEWHSPYFSHVFNLGAFRKALAESCTGIKVRHTSPDKIKSVSVPLPPTLDMQRTLASRLDELAERVAFLKGKFARKVADIAELRQSLLQKAFAGQLG